MLQRFAKDLESTTLRKRMDTRSAYTFLNKIFEVKKIYSPKNIQQILSWEATGPNPAASRAMPGLPGNGTAWSDGIYVT